jgi:GNAT superfamily N-acetyltransferase
MHIFISPTDFHAWPELLSFLRDAFAYMDSRIDPPSSLHRMGVEDLRNKAKEETLIIATEGAELIGCAFVAIRDDCAYVGKVAVAGSGRRKGIARELMAAAERVARQHQRPCLELQTRVELLENHRTFAALGFKKVAETAHAGYSRPTSITMRKPLPANPD